MKELPDEILKMTDEKCLNKNKKNLSIDLYVVYIFA